ncbi:MULTISPECIES: hypothetical protein [Rhodococcus]|nr:MULTISPECIES: hypothetical protein [Rhodococcus]QQZ14457.1 hypothetical protein GO592_33380 [Rhodococcus sp. 21391]
MTDVPVHYSSARPPGRVNTTEWIKAHLERMDHPDPSPAPAVDDPGTERV